MTIRAVSQRSDSDLAVCGGRPAFTTPRYVGTPGIPDRAALHARLDAMLDARRLTNDGPFAQEFEARLAALNDGVEVVAVCNATIGMQLLLKALGVSGEVILPSFTFIATAHACAWEGLEPVFVDVDEATHVIDPAAVAARLSDRTAAIVGVHLWGRMCPVNELESLAAARGIPLLFDAAHALGCTYRGLPMGRLGTASVVSFHATKLVQSLEGGAIFTPDRDLAARLRLMRNFGFAGYDRVVALGTNAKLDEFSAVVGLGSLDCLDAIVERNQANRAAYRAALAGLPGLALYEYDESERNNHQYLVVVVDPARCPLSRDDLVAVLHAENVIARRYFHPGCHKSAPYAERPVILPVTERLSERLITLPTGTGVDATDIATIGGILSRACARAGEVRRSLAEGRPARLAA
jgi:dTDP-4-amino-4,6-dideoxygalactose transaminase